MSLLTQETKSIVIFSFFCSKNALSEKRPETVVVSTTNNTVWFALTAIGTRSTPVVLVFTVAVTLALVGSDIAFGGTNGRTLRVTSRSPNGSAASGLLPTKSTRTTQLLPFRSQPSACHCVVLFHGGHFSSCGGGSHGGPGVGLYGGDGAGGGGAGAGEGNVLLAFWSQFARELSSFAGRY